MVGQTPTRSLAIPMITLNVICELRKFNQDPSLYAGMHPQMCVMLLGEQICYLPVRRSAMHFRMRVCSFSYQITDLHWVCHPVR